MKRIVQNEESHGKVDIVRISGQAEITGNIGSITFLAALLFGILYLYEKGVEAGD